jgi:hypothetical protein
VVRCVIFSTTFNLISLFFQQRNTPLSQGLLIIEVTLSHSDHTTLARGISPTQRPLHENTQQSQETNIHASGGIRTQIPASERPQTHALDHVATRIGSSLFRIRNCFQIHLVLCLQLHVATSSQLHQCSKNTIVATCLPLTVAVFKLGTENP